MPQQSFDLPEWLCDRLEEASDAVLETPSEIVRLALMAFLGNTNPDLPTEARQAENEGLAMLRTEIQERLRAESQAEWEGGTRWQRERANYCDSSPIGSGIRKPP